MNPIPYWLIMNHELVYFSTYQYIDCQYLVYGSFFNKSPNGKYAAVWYAKSTPYLLATLHSACSEQNQNPVTKYPCRKRISPGMLIRYSQRPTRHFLSKRSPIGLSAKSCVLVNLSMIFLISINYNTSMPKGWEPLKEEPISVFTIFTYSIMVSYALQTSKNIYLINSNKQITAF